MSSCSNNRKSGLKCSKESSPENLSHAEKPAPESRTETSTSYIEIDTTAAKSILQGLDASEAACNPVRSTLLSLVVFAVFALPSIFILLYQISNWLLSGIWIHFPASSLLSWMDPRLFALLPEELYNLLFSLHLMIDTVSIPVCLLVLGFWSAARVENS